MDIVVSETSFMHYGVKGMKWGVRREAKRDAKEAARAKMSYGEGAGNRRKLINESVKAKSKKDPNYKKAFDYYYEKQDMAKAAKNARTWRKKNDAKKNARRVGNAAAKAFGYSSLLAAGTILYVSNMDKVNSVVAGAVSKGYGQLKKMNQARIGRDWLKKNGF